MRKRILIISMLLISSMEMNGQTPAWQWARSAGGNINDEGNSIAVDANENSYLTGYFKSPTITFGNYTLTNSGDRDVFIAKFDVFGNVIWAQKANGGGVDDANSIAVDEIGNTYITGYFKSPSITFANTTLINSGSGDVFIAKYDSLGNLMWAKNAGGSLEDYGKEIALDQQGNVYITGFFISPTISFGNDTLTGGFFVAKYDTSGNVIWAKGGSYGGGGSSIAVDLHANIYVTGTFSGSTYTLDSITILNSSSSSGDIFLAKFDSSGNVIWAKGASGAATATIQNIALDLNGNSYITGWYGGDTLMFDTISIINLSGNAELFIAKYDVNGVLQWAQGALSGFGSNTHGRGLTTEEMGYVYLTGDYTTSITFGSFNLNNIGGGLFITKYDSNGNVVWAMSEGGQNYEVGKSIKIDSQGNLYLTGYFNGPSIIFGSDTLTNIGNNYQEVFIAKTGYPVGLEDYNPSNPFFFFPNPTSGHLTITSPYSIDDIKISNLLGQVIYHTKPNQKNVELQMDGEGVYFVSLTSNNQTATRKLIVQR